MSIAAMSRDGSANNFLKLSLEDIGCMESGLPSGHADHVPSMLGFFRMCSGWQDAVEEQSLL
jgi:hypothetical protein